MTTQINFFKRLFAARPRKKNPDWARVEEPDTIARPAMFAIFGVLITGFSMLAAFIVMTSDPIVLIAQFLASFGDDFTSIYAAFGAALIALVNLFIVTLFMFMAPADNDDVVEMISDLDANTQERFVEMENTIVQHCTSIEKAIEDVTITAVSNE